MTVLRQLSVMLQNPVEVAWDQWGIQISFEHLMHMCCCEAWFMQAPFVCNLLCETGNMHL